MPLPSSQEQGKWSTLRSSDFPLSPRMRLREGLLPCSYITCRGQMPISPGIRRRLRRGPLPLASRAPWKGVPFLSVPEHRHPGELHHLHGLDPLAPFPRMRIPWQRRYPCQDRDHPRKADTLDPVTRTMLLLVSLSAASRTPCGMSDLSDPSIHMCFND